MKSSTRREVAPDPRIAIVAQRYELTGQACALRREILSLQSRCGSCNLWMTQLCPRERNSQSSEGPLHDTPKCNKFVADRESLDLIKQHQLELDRIVIEIATLFGQC